MIVIDIILFLITSIGKILLELITTLIGMIIIPFFLFKTEEFKPVHVNARILPNGEKNRRFKDKWFDSIWGNEDDGIYGDINYWNKHFHKPSFLSAYVWTAIRNPIHNLSKRLGVDDYIIAYEEHKLGSLVYSEVYNASGKVYPLLRFKKTWNNGKWTDIYIGYKNFNVNEVPKHYTYQFGLKFNVLRGF